jgi:hypothetical protein
MALKLLVSGGIIIHSDLSHRETAVGVKQG